ncbi:MAG: hypothetical protein ABI337_07925 [Nitrososphaera sp.]
MVSTHLDVAQKSLIKLHTGNKTGDLQFTRFPEYHTFTYNQSGFERKNGFLHLSKIGKIKIICHRQTQNHTIKQITVSQSESGKWHVCLTCEIDVVLPKPRLNKVGIDMGIKNFANSDGFAIPNPNYTKMLKPLKRILKKDIKSKRLKQQKSSWEPYEVTSAEAAMRSSRKRLSACFSLPVSRFTLDF